MELKRLTDLELASNQGEKDRCLEIIRGFDSCEGCSAQCHLIAQAQLDADKAQIQPLVEQAKKETAREIRDYWIDAGLICEGDDCMICKGRREWLKDKYGV